jgi:D-alanine-D-alanine ligase
MQRPLIAVVRGGYTGESVISHQSAQCIIEALDHKRFDVCYVTITRDGWSGERPDGSPVLFDRALFTVDLGPGPQRFDAALIAIHGPPGEDGKLQGYLDMLKVPYQTGDVLNMALSFSKFATSSFLRQWGFPVSPSVLLRKGISLPEEEITALGLPVFVKPDQSGSSLGVTKVKSPDALEAALEAAFAESDTVMVEAGVSGRELTCGVLRIGDAVQALPICEIRTSREFFDYEAKYHAADTEEIVPAPLPDEVTALVQQRSEAIFRALNCRGMVRVDHFWTGQELITIEVNTTPGFSRASIYPKMLKAAGIGVEKVVNALAEHLVQASK